MAIELMKAQVVITGMLDPLKKSMRAAKALVSKTMQAITATIKKMISITKKALLGLAAIYTIATIAAIKQEKSQFLLAAALKATGQEADALMPKFKAFASNIQKVTVHGDEDTLMLMQLMTSLGVTSDQLENATKHAIGLAAATDRDVKSMGMYIALAQQGETTMLRRYIPALRAATSQTEEMAIITRVSAGGFKIAQAAAETTAGKLAQMKNAIGDVFEKIGGPFLDNIKRSAQAVTNWAVNNQEAIGRLSERFDNFLTRIVPMAVTKMREWGEIIWSTIKTTWNFIIDLWKSNEFANAIKHGLDLSLSQFEKWATQLVLLFKGVGSDIAAAVMNPLREKQISAAKKIDYAVARLTMSREQVKKMMAQAEETGFYENRFKVLPTGNTARAIQQAADITARQVIMPPEVKKRYDSFISELKKNTEAIKAKYLGKTPSALDFAKPTIAPLTPFEATGDKKKGAARIGFVGLEEAWKKMATGITGGKQKPEEQTAKNTSEANKHLKNIGKTLKENFKGETPVLNTLMKALQNLGTVGA